MLISVNPFIIDKVSKEVVAANNHKFVAMDIPMNELGYLIHEGVAFTAQFNGKRRAANFKVAGFLAVDVDSGLTLDDVQKIPLYLDHCALLYTTHNHTEENHRFRLVFELEEPITCRKKMEAAYSGLIATFGGDKACKDASRFFFGSSKGSQIVRTDAKLPAYVVDELIALGIDFMSRKAAEEKVKKAQSHDLAEAASKSHIWIPRNKLIHTADRGFELLEDIPLKTRVYCPIHRDNKPSAFVLESKKGVKGIHCGSKCKATYFLDKGFNRVSMSEPHDFDYDWVNAMHNNSESINAHLEALEEYFGHKEHRIFTQKVNGQYLPDAASQEKWDSAENPRILPSIIGIDVQYLHAKDIACHYPKFTNDYFTGKTKALEKAHSFREKTTYGDDVMALFEEKAVSNWLANEGMTFIKSPKGSGKTKMLEEVVAMYKQQNKNVRILLIGHRRSLINATAKRLGLTSYLNNDEYTVKEFTSPTNQYAISLDSLARLLSGSRPYDVVIIDEVEQVFAHLLSETLRKERKNAILYLQHFVNKAKHVYLLDADLTPMSVEIMGVLNKAGVNKDAFAVINTYKANGRELNMYYHKDDKQIVADLMHALKEGKHCFLCSNSKDRINGLVSELKKIMPEKEIMAITSDNSQDQAAQNFIINIKAEAPKYDLIAVSPSLSTGVDITFPDDAQWIDCVFGIFNAGINTHFDIDQQLSRVRHPGQVNVWVSDMEFNFETDPNVIRHELSKMHDKFESIKEIDENGHPVYFSKSAADLLHEAIYGAVTEMKRASMNRLRDNFIALRKHNGWNINPVEADAAKAELGGHIISKGAKAVEAKKVMAILSAIQVDAYTFDELRLKSSRTAEEQAIVDRYYLESFFLTDVTKEMLGKDKGESLRQAVKLYENFQMSVAEREAKDAIQDHHLWFDGKNLRLKYDILAPILKSTGLFDGRKFICNKKICKADLPDFVKQCKSQKVSLETFFKVDISDRIDFDPITKLKEIFGLFSVTTIPEEPPKSYADGTKTYYYFLDEESVINLERWHRFASDEDAREVWDKVRDVESLTQKNVKKAIQKLRAKFVDKSDVDLS